MINVIPTPPRPCESDAYAINDQIYCLCRQNKTPASLRHFLNCYVRGTVVGLTAATTPLPIIQISESDAVYPSLDDILSIETALRMPHDQLQPDDLIHRTALTRMRNLRCEQPYEREDTPGILPGDDVVIFCAPSSIQAFIPDLVYKFVTGQAKEPIPDSCRVSTTVQTDTTCLGFSHAEHDQVAYSQDLAPMVIWRGDYEYMRHHPDWIETWADSFRFPLRVDEYVIGRDDFLGYLRQSFSYIPPVVYTV